MVRTILARCYGDNNYKELYNHRRGHRGQVRLCACPNLCVTIAPAGWEFYLPYVMQSYLQCVWTGVYLMPLHTCYLVRCIWRVLPTATATSSLWYSSGS